MGVIKLIAVQTQIQHCIFATFDTFYYTLKGVYFVNLHIQKAPLDISSSQTLVIISDVHIVTAWRQTPD